MCADLSTLVRGYQISTRYINFQRTGMAARPCDRPSPSPGAESGPQRRVPVDLPSSSWKPPVSLTAAESKEELKRFCTETMREHDCTSRPVIQERQATERSVRVAPVLEDLTLCHGH
jgi:hypothetical protein